jgi:hypothetical protein
MSSKGNGTNGREDFYQELARLALWLNVLKGLRDLAAMLGG